MMTFDEIENLISSCRVGKRESTLEMSMLLIDSANTLQALMDVARAAACEHPEETVYRQGRNRRCNLCGAEQSGEPYNIGKGMGWGKWHRPLAIRNALAKLEEL